MVPHVEAYSFVRSDNYSDVLSRVAFLIQSFVYSVGFPEFRCFPVKTKFIHMHRVPPDSQDEKERKEPNGGENVPEGRIPLGPPFWLICDSDSVSGLVRQKAGNVMPVFPQGHRTRRPPQGGLRQGFFLSTTPPPNTGRVNTSAGNYFV